MDIFEETNENLGLPSSEHVKNVLCNFSEKLNHNKMEFEKWSKSFEIENLVNIDSIEAAHTALTHALSAREIKKQMIVIRKELTFDSEYKIKECKKAFEKSASIFELAEIELIKRLDEFIKKDDTVTFASIEKMKSKLGTLSRKTEWIYEIKDEEQIPKKYWKLDTALIEKEINAGIRMIDGLEISSIEKINIRLK